jgi:hypothetical protein
MTHRESRNRKPETTRARRRKETLRDLATGPDTGIELDTGLRRRTLVEFFLKGPLPWSELAPALKLPGKAGTLWLLIAHRVTYLHDQWVTLPMYACEELGISEDARTDGLRHLEEAGLIAIQRPPGGYLKVRMTWKKPKGAGQGKAKADDRS